MFVRKHLLRVAFWIPVLVCVGFTEGFAKGAASKASKEEEHAVFDGRVYNGKFYPRLEIIEWNEENKPSHMEFQNYTPKTAMDMSFELEEKDGKKVMLVRYHIKDRNEYVCRRVLAPGHFKKGFKVYRDKNDMDRDIIFVSMHPLEEKKGRSEVKIQPYSPCEEIETRLPASGESNDSENVEHHDSSESHSAPSANEQKKVPNSKGAFKKPGASTPFSDW